MPSVDEALLKELHEGRPNRLRWPLFHGEGFAPPVSRGAKPVELQLNSPTVLVHPLPDLVQEPLPAEVVSGEAAVRRQLAHHAYDASAPARPQWQSSGRGRCGARR